MLAVLRQPYPFETDFAKSLRTGIVVGVFVAGFLLVFQPFQLSLWKTEYKTWKIIGYGLVTTLIYLFYFMLLKVFWQDEKLEKSWTVGKEILLSTLFLVSIALGNTVYSAILGIVKVSPQVFFAFIPVVFCVGVFPIAARVLVYHQKFNAKNKKEAIQLDAEMKFYNEEEKNIHPGPEENIVLTAENEKDTIIIPPDHILYIESLDNYAKVVFVNEKGKVSQEILRGALKRFESQIQHPHIRRCHRSFIVNLHNVVHVSGNAQGYRLMFAVQNLEIPVSRAYGQDILSFISHKKA